MANIVEITLKATDKTKNVLGKVGGALAGIGKAAIVGAAAGFAIAGTAALAFGVKAVMAGADAEEMMSKLRATFGESSTGMMVQLDQFAAATGRSRFELRGAAADMGAVLKAMGFSENAAAALAEQSVELATDLGAFNNLPTADVAQRIQRAFTGEFESLKALGIVINQNMLDQEYANMGLDKSTEAITAQQKAMAVQAIMLRQTADAQGAAAAESQSFTGRMVALKASMKDFTTEVGMALLPALTPLLQKFTGFAQEVLPLVAAWIEDHVVPALSKLGDWLGTNLPIAIQVVSDFWNNILLPALAIVGEFIQTTLVPIFQVIVAWLQENIPVAIQVLSNFWTNTLLPILTKVKDFIKTKLVPIFKVIVAWLKKNIPIAVQFLSDLWNNTLYPAIQKIWAFISTYLVPIFLGIANVLAATVGVAIEALAGLWKNVLQPALKTVWEFIQDKVIPIFKKLAKKLTPVKELLSKIAGFLRSVAEKISNLELPSWLIGDSPSPFENTLHGISDALKEISGIRLPKFQAALDFGSPPMMTASSLGGEVGGGFGGNISMDNSRIIELLRSIDEKPSLDEVKLSRLIRDAVLQVTG